jgi:hypothetical protein
MAKLDAFVLLHHVAACTLLIVLPADSPSRECPRDLLCCMLQTSLLCAVDCLAL